LAVALVLGGTAAPAFGQVKLAWRFKEGDSFYAETVTGLRLTVEREGKQTVSTLDGTTVSRFTVLKREGDGAVLQQRIESSRMTSSGDFPGGGEKLAGRLKGAAFTIHVDGAGRITRFDGYDALVKKLSADNTDVARSVRQVLSEDTVKRTAEEVLVVLPPGPVNKGDKWTQQLTLPLGPLGGFKVENVYTYQKKAREGVQIGVASALTYVPPRAGEENALFKVVRGDLKAEEAGGTVLFDPAAGRLVRHDIKVRLKGPVRVELMGNAVTMNLDQLQVTRVRVSDRNPDQ
jgi:hypothetical protein